MATEPRSTTAPRVDGELMPQRSVLEDEISAGADRSEECCDKQTEVEHRRASRGSPILCYLRTELHLSGFAVPRVCMLQDRLALSERRACRVTGQHRSTQRRLPARGRGDDALRTELHAFSRGHPRWGYRRAWATLREEGWTVNRKRVQRLWREEGLRVPLKRRKRQRLGDSAQPARRLSAERPNHVWALDFQFDQTADGRVLKLLNIVDEHTREALAVVAARRINADSTAATLDRIVAGRGTAPGYIRCDNGPEFTANALRDWRYKALNWGQNGRGLYFGRLIDFESAPCDGNQLEWIISSYTKRTGIRRSMLQASVFDPARDHVPQAQLGFPCLQHVQFAPVGETLTVNAIRS